jgi:hypothetical protein
MTYPSRDRKGVEPWLIRRSNQFIKTIKRHLFVFVADVTSNTKNSACLRARLGYIVRTLLANGIEPYALSCITDILV